MIENERKFVLDHFDPSMDSRVKRTVEIDQYYIHRSDDSESRIRKKRFESGGVIYYLQIKKGGHKQSREEIGVDLDKDQYNILSSNSEAFVKKTRYMLDSEPHLNVTVDVFDECKIPDLILMEIELVPERDKDNVKFSNVPEHILEFEVTGINRYYNANLAMEQ